MANSGAALKVLYTYYYPSLKHNYAGFCERIEEMWDDLQVILSAVKTFFGFLKLSVLNFSNQLIRELVD